MNFDLDIHDLHKVHDESIQKKTEIYQQIYYKCCKTILKANNTHLQKQCTFIIPSFKIGEPGYNVRICTAYIMCRLRKRHFIIKYEHPNKIHINWEKKPDYTEELISETKIKNQLKKLKDKVKRYN